MRAIQGYVKKILLVRGKMTHHSSGQNGIGMSFYPDDLFSDGWQLQKKK